MGRFGIQFSEEKNKAFKITKRKRYATVVNLDKKYADEKPLDRVMAWISYYAMVFVAICAFNQPAAAYAYDSVTSKISGQIEQELGSGFTLRSTK